MERLELNSRARRTDRPTDWKLNREWELHADKQQHFARMHVEHLAVWRQQQQFKRNHRLSQRRKQLVNNEIMAIIALVACLVAILHTLLQLQGQYFIKLFIISSVSFILFPLNMNSPLFQRIFNAKKFNRWNYGYFFISKNETRAIKNIFKYCILCYELWTFEWIMILIFGLHFFSNAKWCKVIRNQNMVFMNLDVLIYQNDLNQMKWLKITPEITTLKMVTPTRIFITTKDSSKWFFFRWFFSTAKWSLIRVSLAFNKSSPHLHTYNK